MNDLRPSQRPHVSVAHLQTSTLRRVLNAGSGPYNPAKLHTAFRNGKWNEIRLDIDPTVEPDLMGSITNMQSFAASSSFDAIWSSHNVEHLAAHEVGPAFREFHRILKNDGFALITCPDLQAVARLIADGKLDDIVYTSPAGPITPLDMLFGHSASIAGGNAYMAHNTGLTADKIGRVCLDAGFKEVRIASGTFYDLWALALMPQADINAIGSMFQETDQAKLFLSMS